MKKIITSITIAFAAIMMAQAASSVGPVTGSSDQQLVQDTIPRHKKDSSWNNKKKYPDTTQRHKRDSVRVK